MKCKILAIALFFIGVLTVSNAQINRDKLIQFSGMVVTEQDGQLAPVPFANIILEEGNRGTYSNLDGFFSIVAEKGQKVKFSAVGFQDAEYVIPDSLTDDRYNIYQIMTQDTIYLPQTVVYPWPSKEHFKEEFLALEVPHDLEDRANENLSDEKMDRMKEYTPRSGEETSQYYLRQQANDYYYYGQTPPQNIFSPVAWAQFIRDWKDGKFKKKKEDN